ncbi:chorismate synthase [Proteiniborus ethanoligenes]|uniref:Chorismate synthase n=1 Tax=Proteiniborus ethanoligenes TaxID=415015 RepID=A0A1H3Q064_9FIRM|nr:chorismate synthase [Proteiniborus ethanoligenes]TAH64109.1 MAG: chorismate synthase [Gottschalkiaceae bacterium]SDZ06445.1 chorismate synthase [Proteiniborus ethanoligenes]
MSGIWGKNLKLSIFGESHGKGIGIVINGLPAGLELDFELIDKEMKRRLPGRDNISTKRKESDSFEIISGYFNKNTTGTPLCVIIPNEDKKSQDYDKIRELLRPGHADYTGYMKYKGFSDYRGGGHFSGRLTAPLVFAGAIAKQILMKNNIVIGSHILSIGHVQDDYFDLAQVDINTINKINTKEFPVINEEKGRKMIELIQEVKSEQDSIGGTIEAAILNLKAGIGDPFFDSVESKLSHLLFSIPGVKGVEFGRGFEITKLKGSQANDQYYIQNEEIKTYTNNNGGILGGITNGMPVIFRVGIKPTPSIGLKQKTVNIKAMENVEIKIDGRHDPCIIPRAVPVVEAVSGLAVLDLIMEHGGNFIG